MMQANMSSMSNPAGPAKLSSTTESTSRSSVAPKMVGLTHGTSPPGDGPPVLVVKNARAMANQSSAAPTTPRSRILCASALCA